MFSNYFITGRAGKMYEAQLQTLSHNMANVNTTGFREDKNSFSSVLRETSGGGKTEKSVPYNIRQHVSLDAGLVQKTGNDLDMALRGNAYFRVQLPEGGEAYTRSGHFHMDENYALLDGNNFPVLDESGAPIVLGNGQVAIDEQGNINVNGNALTKIGLVAINDQRGVERLAGSLLKTGQDNITAGGEDARVLQGSLETSNVNAVEMMTSLISVTRNYQSMLKTMEQYSEQMKTLSDKVARLGN